MRNRRNNRLSVLWFIIWTLCLFALANCANNSKTKDGVGTNTSTSKRFSPGRIHIEYDSTDEPDKVIGVVRVARLDAGEEMDAGENNDSETVSQSDPDSDTETDSSTETDTDADVCPSSLALPMAATVVRAAAEVETPFFGADFAFDEEGNMVSVDAYGNAIKAPLDAEASLFAEQIGIRARGIAYLSTGELVFADSGQGSLIMVSSSGEHKTLLNGLDFPNGVDVDLQDNIYVTEAWRGAIHMVNPFTGVDSVIATDIPSIPSGLAFSPDYNTLYCASRSGIVYAIRKTKSGWGPLTVFGTLPGLLGQCEGKHPGDVCEGSGTIANTCSLDTSGSLFCQEYGRCAGKYVGASCTDGVNDEQGICIDNEVGELYCDAFLPCDDKTKDDACIYVYKDDYYYYYGETEKPGICDENGNGFLYCREAMQCEGSQVGDTCVTGDYVFGTCQPVDSDDTDSDQLYCQSRHSCDGAALGDYCVEFGNSGICSDDGEGGLTCRFSGVCDNLEIGTECLENGQAGTCQNSVSGSSYCRFPTPCDGKAEGELCMQQWGSIGVCRWGSGDFGGAFDADAGADSNGGGGGNAGGGAEVEPISPEQGQDELRCQSFDPCENKEQGELCYGDFGVAGTCEDYYGDGWLTCVFPYPCQDAEIGDICSEQTGSGFVCNDDLNGNLVCRVNTACTGLTIGDICNAGGSLYDEDYYFPMIDRISYGTCQENGSGDIFCRPYNSCEYAPIDSLCVTYDLNMWWSPAVAGRCALSEAGLAHCRRVGPCDRKQQGDSCTVEYSGTPGRCEFEESYSDSVAYGGMGGETEGAEEQLFCIEVDPCENKLEGDRCVTVYDEVGTCVSEQSGDPGDDPYPPFPTFLVASNDASGTEDNDSGNDGESLYCRPNGPCDRMNPGDSCYGGWYVGICTEVDGYLECAARGDCDNKEIGDTCYSDYFGQGWCADDGSGGLFCSYTMPSSDCSDMEEGAACLDRSGLRGECTSDENGSLYCKLVLGCTGKAGSDPCTDVFSGLDGTCVQLDNGSLACSVAQPCQGKSAGAACRGRNGMTGACVDLGKKGLLWCAIGAVSGDLMGIETDACGDVYVADSKSGYVWRFSSDGEQLELVADTLKAPITGLAWGNDEGGSSASTLYLSVQGGRELLALPLGVAGRPMPTVSDTETDYDTVDPGSACSDLPSEPLSITDLDKARGYKDLTFDTDGNLIGWDGNSIWKVSYTNQMQLVLADVDDVEGLEYLPDGNLFYSGYNGINQVYADGSEEVIASSIGMGAVSIISDPDGRLYVANGSIYRIDPASKKSELWLDTNTGQTRFSARSITFDADYSLMIIGTLSGQNGELFAVRIDDEMDPVGKPFVYAVGVGSGSYHDGIDIDICGNVYVADYPNSLYRVSPDGEVVDLLINYEEVGISYGHGINFGSGIGGWRKDALYLPQPYDNNTILEVVVGVDGVR